MGDFKNDFKLEEDFYNFVYKPYLRQNGIDSVFMRVNSEATCDVLQKKKDIDVVGDTQEINFTRSLKVVRDVYPCIFWEYEKNNQTHEPGWGIYSEAQEVVYAMGRFRATENRGWLMASEFILHIFENQTIRDYHPEYDEQLREAVGETWANGKLLYKTLGKLIPLAKIPGSRAVELNSLQPIKTYDFKKWRESQHKDELCLT